MKANGGGGGRRGLGEGRESGWVGEGVGKGEGERVEKGLGREVR